MIEAKCTKIKEVTGKGNLCAYADVELTSPDGTPLMLLRAIRVIQQPNQKPWVQMASQQGRDGNWYPVVKVLDKVLKARIKAAVLEAYAALTG